MSAVDRFASFQTALDSPGENMFLLSPSVTPINPSPRAIRADAAGTVTIRPIRGSTDVTITMAAGEILPVRISTMTAATMTVHGIV